MKLSFRERGLSKEVRQRILVLILIFFIGLIFFNIVFFPIKILSLRPHAFFDILIPHILQ